MNKVIKRIAKEIAITLLCWAALLASLSVSAEIYRWVDENGKIHLSDSPPKQQDAEQVDVEINTYEAIDYSKIEYYQPPEKPKSKRVVMYSTAWCGVCKKARNYFQKNGIRFTEYDIDKSKKAREAFDRYGNGGVPLILVGKQTMRGFGAARFERLYAGEDTASR